MSNSDPNDRRKYARIKVSVPIKIQTDAGGSPIRGATADLSLSGCYIETIFPFPIGTNLDLQLSIETTILIAATVVNWTRFRWLTRSRSTSRRDRSFQQS